MKTRLGRRVSCESEWRGRLIIATCVLAGGVSACGSSASDPASGLDSRAATGKPANVSATSSTELGAQRTRQVSDAPVTEKWDRSGQSDRASADQAAIADRTDGTTDEGNAVISPNIPEAIAKDLGSPDAHIRYRALDYWETQGAQAPLDAVFEALDDDDAAIRAKAASIVEQHMDLEKEQDGG